MNAPLRDSAIRLSADVGGTFTDVAAFDEETGALRLGKTLTTPQRLVTGIESGVGKAGSQFAAARMFLHGTTVAINTILERSGAKCALLTTQGFRDIYEIGRVNRPESYNLFFQKHTPLIDRDLRFEIMERMDSQGTVLIPLDEEQVLTRRRGTPSTRACRRSPSCSCTRTATRPTSSARRASSSSRISRSCSSRASHELSQEYREYERTSTAAANAYVGPRVQRYLTEMESASRRRRLRRQFPHRAIDRRAVRRRATRGNPASACWSRAPPPAWSAPRRCAIPSTLPMR